MEASHRSHELITEVSHYLFDVYDGNMVVCIKKYAENDLKVVKIRSAENNLYDPQRNVE